MGNVLRGSFGGNGGDAADAETGAEAQGGGEAAPQPAINKAAVHASLSQLLSNLRLAMSRMVNLLPAGVAPPDELRALTTSYADLQDEIGQLDQQLQGEAAADDVAKQVTESVQPAVKDFVTSAEGLISTHAKAAPAPAGGAALAPRQPMDPQTKQWLMLGALGLGVAGTAWWVYKKQQAKDE